MCVYIVRMWDDNHSGTSSLRHTHTVHQRRDNWSISPLLSFCTYFPRVRFKLTKLPSTVGLRGSLFRMLLLHKHSCLLNNVYIYTSILAHAFIFIYMPHAYRQIITHIHMKLFADSNFWFSSLTRFVIYCALEHSVCVCLSGSVSIRTCNDDDDDALGREHLRAGSRSEIWVNCFFTPGV